MEHYLDIRTTFSDRELCEISEKLLSATPNLSDEDIQHILNWILLTQEEANIVVPYLDMLGIDYRKFLNQNDITKLWNGFSKRCTDLIAFAQYLSYVDKTLSAIAVVETFFKGGLSLDWKNDELVVIPPESKKYESARKMIEDAFREE